MIKDTTYHQPMNDQARQKRLERRQRAKELHRQLILDVAKKELESKGYHNTTMAEVAELAEFSVGALYKYFPNKQCLFAEVILRDFDRSLRAMQTGLQDNSSWEDLLTAFIRYHFNWIIKDRPDFLTTIRDVFYSSNNAITPELLERFRKIQQESIAVLKYILEQTGYPLDESFMAIAVSGIIYSINEHYCMGLLPQAPENYIEHIIELVRAAARPVRDIA